MLTTQNTKCAIPANFKSDSRVAKVVAEMNKYQKRPDSLIQVLHATQDLYGYLPHEMLCFIAGELGLPPSRVFGVATFYTFFSLKPKGLHNVIVCTGTACYVKGAQKVVDALEAGFGIKAGETTADGKLGLQTARCIGACGLAPAVIFDDQVLAKVKPEEIVDFIKQKIRAAA